MSEVDPQSLQGKNPEEASTAEPRGVGDPKPPIGTAATGPKSIYVCCDGTGNEFAAKDSLDGNSNVVKLYTSLKLDTRHVAYYHPGVGTLGDPTKEGLARALSVITGLAFGGGFEDNVLDAYRYLMQHYASGDRVFIFGFSRGAYTARALAGLLHGYGLLCRGNEGHIPYAWRMYTQRVATEKELNAHTMQTDTTFRDTFSHRDFSIFFVGLWDTVSSVGWITSPLRLLDMAQNPTIERGRHAVSIDERRCFYQDNLWGPPVTVANSVPPRDQDLRQVWFSGVHSDVGGSYPQRTSGLANVALKWMIDETRAACESVGDIGFDEARVRVVLDTPELGEPSQRNAALAEIYERPKTPAELHVSLKGIWWLLELLPHRYYDKDDSSVKMRIPLGAYRNIPGGSLIHPSVKERLRTDPCYRPRNITSEEIVDRPTTLVTPPSAGATPDTVQYLYFEPTVCREHKYRLNPILVFVVKVLEIGLAVYVFLAIALLAYRNVHPVGLLDSAVNGLIHFKEYARVNWFDKLKGHRDVVDYLLVVLGVVALILLKWLASIVLKVGSLFVKPKG
jgi:uncharacterized protein (DUF2235 family)